MKQFVIELIGRPGKYRTYSGRPDVRTFTTRQAAETYIYCIDGDDTWQVAEVDYPSLGIIENILKRTWRTI